MEYLVHCTLGVARPPINLGVPYSIEKQMVFFNHLLAMYFFFLTRETPAPQVVVARKIKAGVLSE